MAAGASGGHDGAVRAPVMRVIKESGHAAGAVLKLERCPGVL
jgi:hypothetical protein